MVEELPAGFENWAQSSGEHKDRDSRVRTTVLQGETLNAKPATRSRAIQDISFAMHPLRRGCLCNDDLRPACVIVIVHTNFVVNGDRTDAVGSF